ncbi:hypothetical protein BC834DRAFT_657143 [Gloeopeniophorella convolvens]|nr:hypothetical protein BC834DRAFT_657143 [Gloeopeniophorella convolvens]
MLNTVQHKGSLLKRRGPDGLGKLGDPSWAIPTESRIRGQPGLCDQRGCERPQTGTGPKSEQRGCTFACSQRHWHIKLFCNHYSCEGESHPEQEPEDKTSARPPVDAQPAPRPPRVITPSLATLEKVVSARIYFENLYFPPFRHLPSGEQRRLAMKRDMLNMGLTEPRKEELRAGWRRSETAISKNNVARSTLVCSSNQRPSVKVRLASFVW